MTEQPVSEADRLWAEINDLRAELDEVKTERGLLAKQAEQLHKLSGELITSAERVQLLAQKADEILAKGIADEPAPAPVDDDQE